MFRSIFGKRPSGQRLEAIRRSPNYKNGKFQNVNETPQLTEGFGKALVNHIFRKSPITKPPFSLPHEIPNFEDISPDKNLLIWFGHSSCFLQLDGKKFLVDPVFISNASPLPIGGKGFEGTDIVDVNSLPFIDYVFISHDHYDHLDDKTLIKIRPKVGKVICGLGVGEHLEHWGYKRTKIIEKDWNEQINLPSGITVITAPARHFSGRGIWRSNTLWMSYILKTPNFNIYLGGDSGYDTHFKTIGDNHGPFDLAVVENGQYNQGWKYIHMFPEQAVQAGIDLQANLLLPVHSGKFALANHAWNEPLEEISKIAEARSQKLLTPMIGEVIDLDNPVTKNKVWWREDLHASS